MFLEICGVRVDQRCDKVLLKLNTLFLGRCTVVYGTLLLLLVEWVEMDT